MVKINIDNIIADTLKLVQTKSYTGNTKDASAVYEKMLLEAGCKVERYEFIPHNPTLVARYGNAEMDEKKLIFNGHIDVVPIAHDDPYIKDGRIYGRGTCDMKGALATILEVVRTIHTNKLQLSGEVIIIMNSLHESPGGRGEDLTILVDKISSLQADAAVVMEGATDDCTIAQMGSATFNVTIEREGSPSHQLFTAEGTPHPISVMSDLIQVLNEKNNELKHHYIKDIGYGSYFIGNVSSGEFYNQMPKTAKLEGVCRYGPDQKFEDIEAELKAMALEIATNNNVTINVQMRKVRDGYRIDPKAHIVQVLTDAIKDVRGIDAALVGKKLVTDAGILANGLNIPVVCSGPDQQRAHAEVEFVDIKELELTAKIYMNIIQKYVGLKE